MKRLGTTIRIGFVMTIWSAAVLLGLHLFQVFGDGHETILVSRTRLCEAVAVSCSQLAVHEDGEGIQVVLESFVNRNDDVLSARFRQLADKEVAISNRTSGEHDRHWNRTLSSYQAADHIAVPVYCADEPCGALEVAFRSPVGAAILGFIRLPSPQVTLLASSLNILVFSVWMGYCFRQPNHSNAERSWIPSASEPLAIAASGLDKTSTDTPPNAAFTAILNRPLDRFQKTPFVTVRQRPWVPDTRTTRWLHCLRKSHGAQSPIDEPNSSIDMPRADGSAHHFKARLHPFDDIDKQAREILSDAYKLSLLNEDYTQIGKTLARLKASQREIEEQNRRLTYLATRDPMTGCLNRRSFFEHLDDLWRSSKRYDHPLSCVMVDVDRFKSINDEHGHQTGDQVIEQVALALTNTARDTDFVCRYGGEEFCILLPHVDLAGAWFAAERFREAIEALQIDGLIVTASLGCSDRDQGAADAEQLIDQADQALYYSKRNGRNRTTSFDKIPTSISNTSDAPTGDRMVVEPSSF